MALAAGMGWKEELGSKLRKERQGAGISLRALAKVSKTSPETIRKYELGKVPDADRLVKVARALGISEIDLDDIRVHIARPGANEEKSTGEQLRLDFTGEYTRSKATVKIRPGSVSIAFKGLRVSSAKS